MAILTTLSLDEAVSVGSAYGVAVERVRGIKAGSVNSNYELGLSGGKRLFLRIYEEQTPGTAASEAALLAHLVARGVPTPEPLVLRVGGPGAFISIHRGKPVALFPWIDGKSLCQREVEAHHTFEIGVALARLHLAGSDFQKPLLNRFGIDRLKERLSTILRAEVSQELRTTAGDLRGTLDEVEHRRMGDGGLIHGDLFRDNVLWNDRNIGALLDFESASQGDFAFDLAVSLLAWCFRDNLSLDLAQAMVRGYESVRTLTSADRASLFDATRAAAVRFSITRITDFELRKEIVGVYKDYRRFVLRLEVVEQLGPARFAAALGIG